MKTAISGLVAAVFCASAVQSAVINTEITGSLVNGSWVNWPAGNLRPDVALFERGAEAKLRVNYDDEDFAVAGDRSFDPTGDPGDFSERLIVFPLDFRLTSDDLALNFGGGVTREYLNIEGGEGRVTRRMVSFVAIDRDIQGSVGLSASQTLFDDTPPNVFDPATFVSNGFEGSLENFSPDPLQFNVKLDYEYLGFKGDPDVFDSSVAYSFDFDVTEISLNDTIVTPAPVPLPASLGFLLVGLGGLGAIRVRKRRL